MNDGYETLIITFSEPIEVLDGRFEDIDTWGVDSLKKWVDDYETTRFTPINGYTAVITSEYNMKPVREWLEHYRTKAEMKEWWRDDALAEAARRNQSDGLQPFHTTGMSVRFLAPKLRISRGMAYGTPDATAGYGKKRQVSNGKTKHSRQYYGAGCSGFSTPSSVSLLNEKLLVTVWLNESTM